MLSTIHYSPFQYSPFPLFTIPLFTIPLLTISTIHHGWPCPDRSFYYVRVIAVIACFESIDLTEMRPQTSDLRRSSASQIGNFLKHQTHLDGFDPQPVVAVGIGADHLQQLAQILRAGFLTLLPQVEGEELKKFFSMAVR
jgi:hypothetical protein